MLPETFHHMFTYIGKRKYSHLFLNGARVFNLPPNKRQIHSNQCNNKFRSKSFFNCFAFRFYSVDLNIDP